MAECYLKSVNGEVRMPVSGALTVGRNEDCDLVLVEGNPSREHARLEARADGVYVEDLESTNGTYVNDRKIAAPERLNNGDIVRFDVNAFEFVDPQAAEQELPGAWIFDSKSGGTVRLSKEQLKKYLDDAGVIPPVEKPVLVVNSGSRAGHPFELTSSKSQDLWEIGSDPERDIVLTDEGISGRHAQLSRDGQKWKIADVMATNGVQVNGQETVMAYLSHGDRIRLGSVDCVIQIPEAGADRSGSAEDRARSIWVWVAAALAVVLVATAAVFWFA